MKSLVHWLTELIFPSRCLACSAYGDTLCHTCLAAIPRRTSQECLVCKRPSRNGQACPTCATHSTLDHLLVAGHADHPVLWQAIHTLKYAHAHTLARPLAEYAVRALAHHPATSSVFQTNPLLIPVPLHPQRERERGFNQSALLAQHIADRIGMHHHTDAFERTRATESQTHTHSRWERLHNMQNAFAVRRPELVRGRDIVLVDDVCTTGATLDACASVLKDAGARTVSAVVIARG